MRKTTKSPGEKIVKDIKRATRKQYSSEEKIRIVLDGLRGEDSIAELCRREGISQGRAIALQKPFMRVRGESLLQPAGLNLPRLEPLSVLALMMLRALRRRAAKLAGAWSFLARCWSSFITTSSDQCRPFSICQ